MAIKNGNPALMTHGDWTCGMESRLLHGKMHEYQEIVIKPTKHKGLQLNEFSEKAGLQSTEVQYSH